MIDVQYAVVDRVRSGSTASAPAARSCRSVE